LSLARAAAVCRAAARQGKGDSAASRLRGGARRARRGV